MENKIKKILKIVLNLWKKLTEKRKEREKWI